MMGGRGWEVEGAEAFGVGSMCLQQGGVVFELACPD